MGSFISFPELLLWIPLLGGIICFFIKDSKVVKFTALIFSLLALGVAVSTLFFTDPVKYASYNNVNYLWLKYIGNSFFLGLDATGRMLCLLTCLGFPLIFIGTWNNVYKNASSYFGLMLLSMAGLIGVFVALDALLFYFFWELALIPVYFLCSMWGGEKRIKATFKFFVYTFAGSLLMLIAIIFIYLHTPERSFEDGTIAPHSFALSSFYMASLNTVQQGWLFWLMFIAFAVKMPVFPFHTWQPDTYDQAPTSVTMVLSGIMVKMGLFGVLRWLIPVLPDASEKYTFIVMLMCVAGIIYASCIAMVQDNLKKLVAYSSIAHIGLMCAAIFAMNELSVQGMLIQMFNHGINIIGLWIVVDYIEKHTGVKNLSQLRGLANRAPVLTIMLVIIALANIALPLTNAFVGEFMMFGGLFRYNNWLTAVAGLSIILAAVYTLSMIQKIFYGEANDVVAGVRDISLARSFSLGVIIVLIFVLGIYPQALIDLTHSAVTQLLKI